MTFHNKYIKTGTLALVAAIVTMTSCNKDLEEFAPIPTPAISPLRGIGDTLRLNADDSLFYKVIVRGGMLSILNDKTKNFTLFSPNNAAVRQFVSGASGGAIPPSGAPEATYVGFINTTLPVASAAAVVQYQILPQTVLTTSFGATFANFPYPTMLNPSPAASPFLRLDGYVSTRVNGAWINNIPVIGPNRLAGNGVIHSTAAVSVPPSTLLWDRINADAGLTYLKAAIQRADSGAAPGTSLQYILGTATIAPGLNLTLFAPTDAAFQAGLTAVITQALIGQGVPPATAAATAAALAASPTVFSNPALYPSLTAQTVKGVIVYHILFGKRAFTPNIPTTATSVPTLLNSAVPAHPGVSIAATFTGPVVTAATVKGVANPSASNVLINPLPNGNSDQHYVNGVMHKIDQVLFPQ